MEEIPNEEIPPLKIFIEEEKENLNFEKKKERNREIGCEELNFERFAKEIKSLAIGRIDI